MATKTPSKSAGNMPAKVPAKVTASKLAAKTRAMTASQGFEADQAEIASLVAGTHANPFAFLGLHQGHGTDGLTARCFLPGATQVRLIASDDQTQTWDLVRVHIDGVFAARIMGRDGVFAYHLEATWEGESVVLEDPYRFGSVLTTKEILRFRQGQ